MLLFLEGVDLFSKSKLVIFSDEESLKWVEELHGPFSYVSETGTLDTCSLPVLFDSFNFCLNIPSVDVSY